MTRGTATVVRAVWTIGAPVVLPIWAAITALHPRLRGDRAERLGLAVAPVAAGAVWIHAASVGEIAAADALIRRLPGPILLTADTDTGVARARAIAVAYRGRVAVQAVPVDHPWTIAPIWADARPRAVVFIEGTAWPCLSWTARAAGIPVLRVSAKAGPRTRRWGLVQRFLPADQVVARDAGEASWFARHHGDVIVGGDLKGDPSPAAPAVTWDRPFAAGVSTRPGDEERLITAWLGMRDAVGPRVGLVIAPRHPDRFDAVASFLDRHAIRYVRRTQIGESIDADIDAVLLDTLGELAGVVATAAVAVIGGSFDPAIGAHSPMEAAIAGVPVIAGPHGGNNEGALVACAAVRVAADGLGAALLAALTGDRPAPIAPNGAADRTAAAITARLGVAAPESAPRPWAWPLTLATVGFRTARAVIQPRADRLPVPVIAVGSANARGGGKTSTARAVAAELRGAGHVVGVVVRGYRRARPGVDVRLSDRTATAGDLGDEGALFAGDGWLVAAGPDVRAAACALVDRGVTAIVIDDGLEVQTVAIDLRVAVIDARFPGARGLIPAGERRTVATAPESAVLVIHHADSPAGCPIPGGALIAVRSPGPWRRGSERADPPAGPVAAFAGLARPADFLADLDLPVARFRALADHQVIDDALASQLIAWADGLPLATTAKDRTRLPSALSGVWWRDIEVRIEGLGVIVGSLGAGAHKRG